MAEFGFSDWNKAVSSGGGANYFNLKNGDSVIVRFAYNTIAQDLKWYAVHEFTTPGNPATISCAEPDPNNPAGVCTWCQMGSPRVKRVILPIYNVETKTISYWKRTVKYVNDVLLPLFSEVENVGKPICSQQYKITRRGTGLDTNYSVIPMGQPDMTTVDVLGQVKNPFEIKMIKQSDCDYNPNAAPQNNNTPSYGQANQGFNQQNVGYGQQNNFGGQPQGGYNNFQTPPPTRRTADTF